MLYARENFKIKTNTASFRETREALLLAYDQDLINDEEFVFWLSLLELQKIRFRWLEWWRAQGWLRFYKADVYRLFDVVNIPEVLITYSRSKFHDIEAFCIFLKQRKALANHVQVLGAKYANMLWLLKHLDFSVPKENIDQIINQRFRFTNNFLENFPDIFCLKIEYKKSKVTWDSRVL